MNFRNILALLAAVTATIFILQNAGSVDIRFLFWGATLSLSILLIMMILLGFLLGWFVHFFAVRAKNRHEKIKEKKTAGKNG